MVKRAPIFVEINTDKIMYNILYFHGLNSFLSDDKRKVLEQFGTVTAPIFEYHDPKVLKSIIDSFDDSAIKSTIVMGSSFGGYIANILAVAYDIPCLLFNPALAYRSIDLKLASPFPNEIKSLSYIVLGEKDEVIKCEDNLNFISEHFKGPKKVIVEKNLGHRIPVGIFEKHVEQFFLIVNKNEPGLPGD